jgi:hypothetical protein
LTSLNCGGVGRGALLDAAVQGVVDSLLQLRQGAVGLRPAVVVKLGPHRVGDPGAECRRLAERLHVGQAAGGLEDARNVTTQRRSIRGPRRHDVIGRLPDRRHAERERAVGVDVFVKL